MNPDDPAPPRRPLRVGAAANRAPFAASLAVSDFAAACVLVLGSALVPLVGPGLERKLGEPGGTSPFMLLMMANLAATLPLSVFPTVLDGLQRFAAKSAGRLAFLALRVGGIVFVME